MPGILLPSREFYESDYTEIVKETDPLAHWTLGERFGATAYDVTGNEFNGTITGATPGQPGIGDGLTSMLFDGANDWVDVFSAGLAARFNDVEGAFAIWCRMFNLGVWTDGNQRRAFDFRRDVNNRIYTYKPGNNSYRLEHNGAGVAVGGTQAAVTVAWFHWVMTWSISGGATLFYFNSVPFAPAGAPTAWAGAMAAAAIGAQPGAVWPFYGWLQHASLWTRPLPPAEVEHLYCSRWTR